MAQVYRQADTLSILPPLVLSNPTPATNVISEPNAKAANVGEDIIDNKFLEQIKEGVGDLVALEVKRFMRELTV